MAYVYQHIRLDTNEVFYVGIGKTKYRAYNKSTRNNYWKRIVNKAGYLVEIITEDITWEEACQKEKELIKYYGRRNKGSGTLVNMTDGGEGYAGMKRHSFSQDHKEKLSSSNKCKKLSQEHKQKLSIAIKGKKLKPLSEEHKQKLSNAIKGRSFSEESKKKMSDAHKGKKLSQEHKQNLSSAHKGIPRPKLTCTYCGKIGGDSNMKRYHFENCKDKT